MSEEDVLRELLKLQEKVDWPERSHIGKIINKAKRVLGEK